MTRKTISPSLRSDVLAEAGYRCAVPACRGILALDSHHLVEVAGGGEDSLSSLVALCPTCHALYTRGAISKEAIHSCKSILASPTAAFDREIVTDLLFLRITTPRRILLMSGYAVLRFGPLIVSEYAGNQMVANNGKRDVTYTVWVTAKGLMLVDAWVSGDRESVKNAISGALLG